MIGEIALALAAFVPAVLYVVWIRNTERYNREPWGAIFAAFVWGATVAVAISLLLEIVFSVPFSRAFPWDARIGAAIVLAPLAEEFAKPLGVSYVRKTISEPEDGLVYGAICGLGFAATENLIYEWDAASAGSGSASSLIATILVRSIASMLLHASATAITGYGISLMFLERKEPLSVLPFYLAAVLIHGAFNLIVSVPVFGSLASLALAIAFSLGAIKYVRTKIMKLDAREFWQDVVWWK